MGNAVGLIKIKGQDSQYLPKLRNVDIILLLILHAIDTDNYTIPVAR